MKMAWIRLEDGFATHPKVIGLSNAAFRSFIEALCYAGKHLTDGHLPPGAVQRIGRRWLAECEGAGLLTAEGNGYVIHDFLSFNPSREQVEEERRKARERRANGARASHEVRANVGRTSHAPAPAPKDLALSTDSKGPNGMEPVSVAEAAKRGLNQLRGGAA